MKFSNKKFSQYINRINKDNVIHLFASMIIAIGGFLRIFAFSSNRSLWLDEAYIALNIINRSFFELTKVLDRNQSAPIGFLWVEKIMVSLPGNQDLLLRTFPLIAGIVSMVLMWKLSRKFFHNFFALIPLLLFSINDRLIYYSSEVKQYSFDVLVVLILLLLAIKFFEDQSNFRQLLILGIAGALLIWFSHPSIFILSGIGLALLFDHFMRRKKTGILLLIGIITVWLASFGFEYIISLRGIALQTGLNTYWSDYFMPVPPWSNPYWFVSTWKDLIFFLGYKNNPLTIGVSIIFLVGVLSTSKQKFIKSLLLLSPFLLILVASGMEKYPFFRRLLLFIFPILFLMITAGLEGIHSILSCKNKIVARLLTVVLVIFLILLPGQASFGRISHPIQKENTKALLTSLQSKWEENDIVYVHYSAAAAFLYYSEQFGFTKEEYSIGKRSNEKPKLYKGEIDQLNHDGRIWILFSHQSSEFVQKDKVYILKYMRTIGNQVYYLNGDGSSLYLFEVSSNQ